MFDKTLLYARILVGVVAYIAEASSRALYKIYHRQIYHAGESPKNVIVVGAGFAGHQVALQLANSLPSGYRVVLIEKNSHFNFTWIFPRLSVVPGHDHKAFIPYMAFIASVPKGSLIMRQDKVVSISKNEVTLRGGEQLGYSYLVLATGTTASPPSKFETEDSEGGMRYFRNSQQRIQNAHHIVVVGGGAVGVEISTDIKSRYPDKAVSMVHSREMLLNKFGPKLHEATMHAFQILGIDVYLGERPNIESESPSEIVLKSGQAIPCDLLIKCTGIKPVSNLLSGFSPISISPSDHVLVKKSLQLNDPNYQNVYAVGDVADTVGPKMARAAMHQAIVAATNILRDIKGEKKMREYIPQIFEGMIDLTLGLGKGVVYMKDERTEVTFQRNHKHEALFADAAWKHFGAKPYEAVDMTVPVEKT